jgi:hypothetical protein
VPIDCAAFITSYLGPECVELWNFRHVGGSTFFLQTRSYYASYIEDVSCFINLRMFHAVV